MRKRRSQNVRSLNKRKHRSKCSPNRLLIFHIGRLSASNAADVAGSVMMRETGINIGARHTRGPHLKNSWLEVNPCVTVGARGLLSSAKKASARPYCQQSQTCLRSLNSSRSSSRQTRKSLGSSPNTGPLHSIWFQRGALGGRQSNRDHLRTILSAIQHL